MKKLTLGICLAFVMNLLCISAGAAPSTYVNYNFDNGLGAVTLIPPAGVSAGDGFFHDTQTAQSEWSKGALRMDVTGNKASYFAQANFSYRRDSGKPLILEAKVKYAKKGNVKGLFGLVGTNSAGNATTGNMVEINESYILAYYNGSINANEPKCQLVPVTTDTVNQWVHIMAVIQPDGNFDVYVDGTKATDTPHYMRGYTDMIEVTGMKFEHRTWGDDHSWWDDLTASTLEPLYLEHSSADTATLSEMMQTKQFLLDFNTILNKDTLAELRLSKNGVPMENGYTVSADPSDPTRLVVAFDQALELDSAYTIDYSALQDVFGSTASGSLVLDTNPINYGPVVVQTNLPKDSDNISLLPQVSMTFDQPLDNSTLLPEYFTLAPADAAVTGIYLSPDGMTLGFGFDKPLSSNTSYVLTLSDQIKSANEYQAPIKQSYREIPFHTMKEIQLSSSSIANGATNVAVDPTISMTFQMPLNQATINPSEFLITPSDVSVAEATLSSDGMTLTIALSDWLTPDTAYTLILPDTIKDAATNILSIDPLFREFSFTTTASPNIIKDEFDQFGVGNHHLEYVTTDTNGNMTLNVAQSSGDKLLNDPGVLNMSTYKNDTEVIYKIDSGVSSVKLNMFRVIDSKLDSYKNRIYQVSLYGSADGSAYSKLDYKETLVEEPLQDTLYTSCYYEVESLPAGTKYVKMLMQRTPESKDSDQVWAPQLRSIEFNHKVGSGAVQITQTSPATNDKKAPLSNIVDITYSAPVNPYSLRAEDFTIDGGMTVQSAEILSDKCTVRLRLNENTVENAEYNVTTSGSLKDAYRRTIAPAAFSFTTCYGITAQSVSLEKADAPATQLASGNHQAVFKLRNGAKSSKFAVIFAVVYENGKLQQFLTDKIEVSSLSEITRKLPISIKNADNAEVRLFVWEDYGTMNTLTPANVYTAAGHTFE